MWTMTEMTLPSSLDLEAVSPVNSPVVLSDWQESVEFQNKTTLQSTVHSVKHFQVSPAQPTASEICTREATLQFAPTVRSVSVSDV